MIGNTPVSCPAGIFVSPVADPWKDVAVKLPPTVTSSFERTVVLIPVFLLPFE